MALEDALKYPLEKRIALVFDYDLTMTEEWQQVHYIAYNLDRIKEAYNGEKRLNRNTGKIETIKIETPTDYFRLSDNWGQKHNGVGYVMQMLRDGRRGLFKDFNEKMLMETGAKVKISPGLPNFISNLRKKWKGKCDIRSIIVSVGLTPMINGGRIVKSGLIDGVYATIPFALDDYWDGVSTGNYDSIEDIVVPFNKASHVVEMAKGGKIEVAKGGQTNLNKILGHDKYLFDYRNVFIFGDGTSDISQFAYMGRKGARILEVYEHDNYKAYQEVVNNETLSSRANAIKPRDYRRDSYMWTYVNYVIKQMLERTCNFDPEVLYSYKKGKIRFQGILDITEKHITECSYCREYLHLDKSPPNRRRKD